MVGIRHLTKVKGLPVKIPVLAIFIFAVSCGETDRIRLTPPTLIAHAGGIGNHRTYTNSLEALDLSAARGYTAVEIDFSWTRDDHLVLLHDWMRDIPLLLDRPPGRMSLEEYRSARSPTGLTLLTLNDLEPWLTGNPEILVFTDFKERNVEGLGRIADAYPQYIDRIVPQVYRPDELASVRDLGFKNIIWTLYDSDLDDDDVVGFASRNRLFGITMPIRRALEGDLPTRLVDIDVLVFAHPVNDFPTMIELQERGVAGVYTDWLSPGDAEAKARLEPWSVETRGLIPIDGRVVSFVPAKMAGLAISLVFRNEGADPEPVLVELVSPNGEVLRAAEIVLDHGAENVLSAVELFQPTVDHGWIRATTAPGVLAESRWAYHENPAITRVMEPATCSTFIARGTGAGVSGLLLALVNPTQSTHSYVLRRRIGLDLVDDESVELAPGHQLIRVYRSSTDEDIELRAEGGPMIPLILRWDPLVRFIE
jgi:glycerophosphoryl diester phosphodiesterase